MQWDTEPTPADTFPPARPHPLNFPKQHHQLGTSVQMPGPAGDIRHREPHSILTKLDSFQGVREGRVHFPQALLNSDIEFKHLYIKAIRVQAECSGSGLLTLQCGG